MFDRHSAYILSDKNEPNSGQKGKINFWRFCDISHEHGGLILPEHRIFAAYYFMRQARSGTEVQRAKIWMKEMITSENQR